MRSAYDLDSPRSETRPVCATRPAEWYETGDGGNRLAMMLCNVCPLLARCPALDGDGRAFGLVAAGIAWSEFGKPLRVCGCGRPIVAYRPETSKQRTCDTCRPAPGSSRHSVTDKPLLPCGTIAAAARHRYHKEPLCDACREVVRARDRERVSKKRAAA